jgi:RNase adaptor protein for sRNA GlmZ degradation
MGLHIRICSFGYQRSGIPDDPSGNSGGFVFDCRGLPNPGREARYASQSGLDEDVRAYLKRHPEVGHFLESVFRLVDLVVERYRQSGYTELQICFGCTGGQHRSVFCAEELAAHLRSAGVSIELSHTEKGRWW